MSFDPRLQEGRLAHEPAAQAQAWLALERLVDERWSALREALGGCPGTLYSYARWGGQIVVDGQWGTPTCEQTDLYWSVQPPWTELRRGAWTARAPQRHHWGRFAPLGQDLRPLANSPHTHHAFLSHAEQLVGHALVSLHADPGPAAASPLLALREALALRWSSAEPGLILARQTIRADGQLRSWCEGAQRLMRPCDWDVLREALREDADPPQRLMCRGLGARVTRLGEVTQGSPQGSALYLVTLERPEPLSLDPLDALTPQQRRVVQGVCAGQTNAQIAQQLGISSDGVKYHLKTLYAQLSVSSRAELAALAAGAAR